MERRESQYTEDYLRANEERGSGRGLTVGSYLAGILRGKAKKYGGRYVVALQNSLERRVREGSAYRGVSVNGKLAYYPRISVNDIVDILLDQTEIGAEPDPSPYDSDDPVM